MTLLNSGSLDQGPSEKVGGVYNSTPPTLDNGDRGDAQLDQNANWKVSVANSLTIGAEPALALGTDGVTAFQSTYGVSSGSAATWTVLPAKFKQISITASQTDTSVVAAVTSKKIRVLSLYTQCGGTATDITFESDDPSADTTIHKVTPGINGGAALPFSPIGWFETDAGEALIATTGAGSTTQITLAYIEV